MTDCPNASFAFFLAHRHCPTEPELVEHVRNGGFEFVEGEPDTL